jgi:choline dehydrogenase-like flavoprotein
LRGAARRHNLKVLAETRVHKVLFEGRRATGVRTEAGGTYGARREVVLTAGAIATPKILQLSGVGDAKHLSDHGIEVVSDIPGVGENYQDHLEASVQAELAEPASLLGQDRGLRAAGHMLQYLVTKTGLLTSNVIETGGFVDTAGAGAPDVQFHVLPLFCGFADRPAEAGHGITIEPGFLRPQSRGTVKLRSANPKDAALFNANSLSHPADLETLVRGVQ